MNILMIFEIIDKCTEKTTMKLSQYKICIIIALKVTFF